MMDASCGFVTVIGTTVRWAASFPHSIESAPGGAERQPRADEVNPVLDDARRRGGPRLSLAPGRRAYP
jgi:hypothetical protein